MYELKWPSLQNLHIIKHNKKRHFRNVYIYYLTIKVDFVADNTLQDASVRICKLQIVSM